MDDVHRDAFDQRYNKDRLSAILGSEKDNANVEAKDNLQKEKSLNGTDGDIQIYPWPKFFVKKEDSNSVKYELAYLGDLNLQGLTKGNDFDTWPEVQFLEEYIKGDTERDIIFNSSDVLSDEQFKVNRLTLNAIEFPTTNQSYGPKEEVKFFYEIMERLLIVSSLSELNRSLDSHLDIASVISEIEAYNILTSLGSDNPYIISKLKEFNIGSFQEFEAFLKQISNQGIGESWQLYIRGEYVTPYLKDLSKNDFNILDDSVIDGPSPDYNVESIDKLKQYLSNFSDNVVSFIDIAPFTNIEWLRNNVSYGQSVDSAENALLCNKVISFNETKKQLMNFNNDDTVRDKRPLVNFSTYEVQVPEYMSDYLSIKSFYFGRYNDINNLLPTEGKLNYENNSPSILGNQQTISILNSPFMLNAIQDGVFKEKQKNITPFVEASYLFLNSLPLATLKERYKSNNDGFTEDLDFIFASFKKFGATHRLPYAWILKYGSIWHRYKEKIENNVDILSSVWQNSRTIENFDPVTLDPTRTYNLQINGETNNIVLQNSLSNLGFNVTTMNLGFYPKAINDIHYFVTGSDYFSGYTNFEIQEKINNNLFIGDITLASITKSTGFDTSDPYRILKMNFWYSLLKTNNPTEFNSENRNKILVLPSFGSNTNQIKFDCFTSSDTLREEVMSNKSIYDGSARLFWAAPNYGYIDITKFQMPEYDEYFKEIYTTKEQQDSFSLGNNYSSIDEIVPTFKKEILDKFEEEFLKFTKSSFDIPEESRGTDSYLKNFQLLLSQMLLIDEFDISSVSGQQVVDEVWNKQTLKIGEIITSFLENDILFRYGNPSNFNRKVYNSLSTKTIVDPYTFEGYKFNSLPTNTLGSITLSMSETINADAWKMMKEYVGVYTIPGMKYSDSGSTLTDFFIDMDIRFTPENVKTLYSLIQIYGTQKNNGSIDAISFKDKLNDHLINDIEIFQGRILNGLITILQKKLPNVTESKDPPIISAVNSDNLKLELWEHFKSFNDKWVAGNDYKLKTLFEDVLFLDRASRNIGDDIYVDIFQFKDYLKNKRGRVLDLVSFLLEKSKFVMMPLAAFVNYWGVTTPGLTETPIIESSSDFANDIFGTFMNVDYRNSSPKLVCFYTDVPSEHLDQKNNPNYPFRTDAFDMRIPDNPNRESLLDKKDWYFSNKCVSFNVDFGTRNQGMFKSFSLSQDNTQNTSESFKVMQDLADAAGGKTVAQESQSLFKEYRSRSYSCTVFSLGNVLIQPTMYFNLRHVPMFSGSYLILTVKHRISSGDFVTEFTGVRVPYYSLPRTNNSLMSLNINLFKKVFDELKNRVITTGATANNIISLKTGVLTTKDRIFQSVECPVNPPYNTFTPTPQGQRNSLSINEIVEKIKQIVIYDSTDLQKKIRAMVFATIYVDGGNDQEVISWNNNYGGAPLEDERGIIQYSNLINTYFLKEYICLLGTDGKTWPYATFQNVEKNLGFLRDKLIGLNGSIDISNDETLANSLFSNWSQTWVNKDITTTQGFKTLFEESVRLMNSRGLFL